MDRCFSRRGTKQFNRHLCCKLLAKCPKLTIRALLLASRFLKYCLMGMIRLYSYCISPLIASRCRFYPSCSTFALEALDSHGLLRGSFLTVKRLLRCNPWHPGGFDPVQDVYDDRHQSKPDNHTY